MAGGFDRYEGMENITATTLQDTTISLTDYDFGKPIVIDLVSHELAHSWFGNLVTCKNWSELLMRIGRLSKSTRRNTRWIAACFIRN